MRGSNFTRASDGASENWRPATVTTTGAAILGASSASSLPAASSMVRPDRSTPPADVHVPVLVVAGESDGIAPRGAVFQVAELLPDAPDVRLETAPGGHLGVLTGRAARRTTWVYLDQFLDEVALAPIEEAVSATAA